MLALLAGSLASAIFIGSAFPTLWKALRTRDMRSYSQSSLALSVVGNTVQWCYVVSLPLGPIYVLHAFSTICTGVMLVLYLRYRSMHRSRHHYDIRTRLSRRV